MKESRKGAGRKAEGAVLGRGAAWELLRGKTPRRLALSLIIALSVFFCGCNNGQSGTVTEEDYAAEAVAETWAETAASTAYDAGFGMGKMAASDDVDIAEYEKSEEYPAAIASGSNGISERKGGGASEDDAGTDVSRKLIRTVDLSFETDNFDAFVAAIEDKVKALSGYVESSDLNGSENSASKDAYYVLRIPVGQLDGFLDFAAGEGNLVRKYETTEDITLQYHDIESRKEALETEYDRILELLSEAESVDSIIALESRLSDIRYQLESYGSNLRIYDNQVEYATVTMSVSERKVMTPTGRAGFIERASAGLEESLWNLQDSFIDLMVFLISYLPQILFLLLIIFIVSRIFRRARKRKLEEQKMYMQAMPVPFPAPAPNVSNASVAPNASAAPAVANGNVPYDGNAPAFSPAPGSVSLPGSAPFYGAADGTAEGAAHAVGDAENAVGIAASGESAGENAMGRPEV